MGRLLQAGGGETRTFQGGAQGSLRSWSRIGGGGAIVGDGRQGEPRVEHGEGRAARQPELQHCHRSGGQPQLLQDAAGERAHAAEQPHAPLESQLDWGRSAAHAPEDYRAADRGAASDEAARTSRPTSSSPFSSSTASRPSSSSVRPSSSSASFPPSENGVGGAEHARAQPLPRTIETAIRAVKEATARSAAILRSEITFTNSETQFWSAACASSDSHEHVRRVRGRPHPDAASMPVCADGIGCLLAPERAAGGPVAQAIVLPLE